MNDTNLIKQIIEDNIDIITHKVIKVHFPNICLDDTDENCQLLCRLLVKNAMYSLFIYDNYPHWNWVETTIEQMAKIIHRGTILFNNTPYEEESNEYKQYCRDMAKVALEYLLPIIHQSRKQALQSRSSQKGFRNRTKRVIQNIKDFFDNGGG